MSFNSYWFNPSDNTLEAIGTGVRICAMPTAQRTALALGTAGAGMIVFDTNIGSHFTWSGTAWISGMSAVPVGIGAGNVSSNIAIGIGGPLGSNTSGNNNVAIGNGAVIGCTTGVGNVGIGTAAGAAFTTISGVTAVGYQALSATTVISTALGYQAGKALTNPTNGGTFLGYQAGTNVTTGPRNTAVGYQSLLALSTGTDNTVVGDSAGSNLTNGNQNIIIGSGAAASAASVSNELSIGSSLNYVATSGGATTYFATATAGAVALPANAAGFIQIRLNGSFVKIPVYAP